MVQWFAMSGGEQEPLPSGNSEGPRHGLDPSPEVLREALQRSHVGDSTPWEWDTDTTDEAAEDAKAGPSVDFEVFYKNEQTRLIAFLINLGARPADAPDIAQQAMIKAYTHWAAIEHPRAWVRQVASRDCYRYQLSDHEELSDVLEEHSSVQSMVNDIDAIAERDVLGRLLKSLSARQRQVFVWNCDGFDVTAIATHLGLEPPHVSNDLWRAKHRLQALLKQEGYRT